MASLKETQQYPQSLPNLPEQETYFELDPLYSQQMIKGSESSVSSNIPPLQLPQSGTVYANTDDIFLKFLFDHKTRTIVPLKYAWRGMEWSNEQNKWVSISNNPEGTGRIMNEKGITWAASLLESYFNPVFLATNLSVRNYNFRMRTASRFILNTLCSRYKEFELRASDIDRVAEEIESKLSALLAGAINDGYRRFLTTQTHITENKNYGMTMQPQGTMTSIFNRGAGMSIKGDSY